VICLSPVTNAAYGGAAFLLSGPLNPIPGREVRLSHVRRAARVGQRDGIFNKEPRRYPRPQLTFQSALVASLIVWIAAGQGAESAAEAQPLPELLVIGSTPVPGTAIDAGKIPGNVQMLSAADLSREGTASLTQALDSNLSSININENLDDPFQPDILYRGFE